MSESVVPDFGNFPCSGCGQTASVSTRMGVEIACPCGMTHAAKGIVVETSGTCTDPGWHDRKVAAERAERGK